MHPSCPRLLSFALFASLCPAQDLAGTWFTSRGVLELKVDGTAATGKYGAQDSSTFDGRIDGRKVEFTAAEGDVELTGTLEIDKSGHRFSGDWKSRNGSGTWRGWRNDPALAKAKPLPVAGFWRTSWGLLELEQKGNQVTGGYGAQGWSKVTGELEGRVLKLAFENPMGRGRFELDVEADGKRMLGNARADGGKWPLLCQRLDGHTRGVAPKAGTIVAGLGQNRLVYWLRAPKSWKPGSKLPLLVILHGSNYCSRPYVESIANSPIGERYLVVGIDGESWEDWSEPGDPRQNYTYVNFMGKSTYEGYPNTHRESPALVAELIEQLQKQVQPPRTFVGGHSQGGFLTWFFAMHYPELVHGVFPISAGMVMQCEPDVFTKAELLAAQRRVAIAVVHGENDPNVAFAQGKVSWQSCMEQGFPRLRLFANQAGHGFSSLPWLEAVEWLEAMTSDDVAGLTKFATAAIDDYRFRDASAAIARLRASKNGQAAAVALARKVDEYGAGDAEKFGKALAEPGDGGWIDEFLAFRDQFEFADCAHDVMAKFTLLRREHDKASKELFATARRAFQQGKRDEGWAAYERLAAECWASALYPRVKGWLADRR